MSDKYSLNLNLRHASQSIVIARQNLIAVCSLCVKSILDKACFQVIDESSLDLQNFLNIIESIFFFQFKGNIDSKRNPYTLLRQCATSETRHLVHTVESLDKLTHFIGKFRASLRLALMHKCLYQLFESMLVKRSVLELHYFEDSVMRSPTAAALFSQLAGLAALDLSFDLRCERQLHELCYPRTFPVDYAAHMQMRVLEEAKLDDQVELGQEAATEAAGTATAPKDEEEDVEAMADCQHCNWRARYLRVEAQLKRTAEQKSYLEEMNTRLAEERKHAVETKEAATAGHAKEIALYESVVLELQVQLTLLQEQYNRRLAQLNSSSSSRIGDGRRSSSEAAGASATSAAQAAVGDVHAGDGVTRPRLPQLINRLDTGEDGPLTRVSVNDSSCELESQEFDEDTVAYRTPSSATQLDRGPAAFGFTEDFHLTVGLLHSWKDSGEQTLHQHDFMELVHATTDQQNEQVHQQHQLQQHGGPVESSNSSSDLVKLDSACDSAEVIPSDSPAPEDEDSFSDADQLPQQQLQQQQRKQTYYTLMAADVSDVASSSSAFGELLQQQPTASGQRNGEDRSAVN